MTANSKIEWTDHTFNPWWGCVRVSPGCQHCYAETFAKRTGNLVWGVDAPRRFFGAKHWAEPLKWNAAAEAAGVRARVFCASMADVFEDRRDLDGERTKLWTLIGSTRSLDWLLLTKRPENMARLLPGSLARDNVWLGTTCEDQQRANQRIPHLLSNRAAVRFLSCEPLLAPVDARHYLGRDVEDGDGILHDGVSWVIVGGESGPGSRPFATEWARSIVQQCDTARVPCFVKQMGARPVFTADDLPQDLVVRLDANGHDAEWIDRARADGLIRLGSRKGSDVSEWPADLVVRQFPGDVSPYDDRPAYDDRSPAGAE